jgi:aminoglycoside phosphotransferase (APT) family kinase protein
MDSLTKPTLSPQQLASICQRHLGDRLASSLELKDGWFNAAFLLTTKSGREAVLKVGPPASVRLMRYEANMMYAEVSVLQILRADAGVPVPTVIAYDTSREFVDSDLFLSERLRGKPLNHLRNELDAESQERIDANIGIELRKIHDVGGSRFGVFNQPIHASWPAAFLCLVDWLRSDADDLGVEIPVGAFDEMAPHLWALTEVERPALVHWDLWDGNIFVDPETYEITGLIDCERALWGDPLLEFNFLDPKPSFLRTYGNEIYSRPGARTRRQLYDLYLHLIYVIETKFRGFDENHELGVRKELDDVLSRFRTFSEKTGSTR